MTFAAKILKDSVGPNGIRLTTMQVTFPRIVLSEFNTHRVFSRNSASSRAIPIEKRVSEVLCNPFIPTYWGKNQKGMQADGELNEMEQGWAREEWLKARDQAVTSVCRLNSIGLHKQISNRLLEPWLWTTVIVTATEWENFFGLRCNSQAQPEIRKVADMMKDVYESATPSPLKFGEWHLPLLQPDETVIYGDTAADFFGDSTSFNVETARKVCVGRCARVSYLTHDGKRDPAADVALAERLMQNGHMSPFEHIATPSSMEEFSGNLRGWVSYRKLIPNEDNFRRALELRSDLL